MSEPKMITVELPRVILVRGLPLTPELQALFGPYGGSPVTGVVRLRDGLHVGYADGTAIQFVPVPAGGTLVAQADGTLAVRP